LSTKNKEEMLEPHALLGEGGRKVADQGREAREFGVSTSTRSVVDGNGKKKNYSM